MKENDLFSQLELGRLFIGLATKGLSDEQAHSVPNGFHNNIHWQLGHVLLSTETLLLTLSELGSTVPKVWGEYFLPGTSPKDFTKGTPTLQTIRTSLKGQTYRLRELLTGKLERNLSKPIEFLKVTATTVEQALLFSLFHEGLHLGQIQSIRKMLG